MISARLLKLWRHQHFFVFTIIFVSTVFRAWFSYHHDLLQDEAYYWQWSRHLAWGYYDNTPFMAVLIRAFTTVFGTSELSVRGSALLSAVVISVFIYLLALKFTNRSVALVAIVLSSMLPLFAAGSVIMTQDPVQLMFWTATLWTVASAIDGRRGAWLVAGICAGLTIMSKLNGVLLLPSILLFIVLDPVARARWLKRPEPYAAAALALLMFVPFVWWNASHHDAFWHHISAMGTRSSASDGFGKWFLRFLGDQAIEISPGFFFIFLFAIFQRHWGKGNYSGRSLFLWCPTIVVFGATALLSFTSKVEGNWAVAAYPTGVILTAAFVVQMWGSGSIAKRVMVVASAIIAAFISSFFLTPQPYYRLGLMPNGVPGDRTNELYGWDALGEHVAQVLNTESPGTFVFSVNYKIPSELAFYLPGRPQTYSFFLHDRPSEYEFWENPKRMVGRNGLFVIEGDSIDRLPELETVFHHVTVLPPFNVYRPLPYGIKPIRTLQLAYCTGFRGYNQKHWVEGF